jgi:predicted HTH domain antitoxin
MSTVNIEIDEELIRILREMQQPIDNAATELIVLELYRLGKISSGRGAAILHMPRTDFIQHASDLGIPYPRITAEDLDREIQTGRSL